MTSFTNRMRKAAALAVCISALTGAALAHAGTSRQPSRAVDLQAQVAAVELPGFWSTSCPALRVGADAWAGGDRVEAGALRSEGFVAGVREQLRSSSGDRATAVALTFGSPREASIDLHRRERLSRRTVRAAYVRGSEELVIEVVAPA